MSVTKTSATVKLGRDDKGGREKGDKKSVDFLGYVPNDRDAPRRAGGVGQIHKSLPTVSVAKVE